MRPRKKILCVDCNEQTLSVRKFLLETRGFRVIPTQTSVQALEILGTFQPYALDLLICELLMPDMDGNELVRRAKQLLPELPAMIVSNTVNAFERALYANVFLPKGTCSPTEVYEWSRRLTTRKCGPKPTSHVHNFGSQAERVA
jgi:two-component system response regulator CpxR